MDFLRTDANIVCKLFAKDEKHIVTIILYVPYILNIARPCNHW